MCNNLTFSFSLSLLIRCEVSQKFLPKYERLAEQFNNKNGLKFGTVDCTSSNDLCVANAAEALEIILYKKEEGKAKFRGVRNVDGVTKFLIKHLGEDILVNFFDRIAVHCLVIFLLQLYL